jgi:hypothetical protein
MRLCENHAAQDAHLKNLFGGRNSEASVPIIKFLHNSDGSSCIIGSKNIPAQEEINFDTWKVFYQQETLLKKGGTG